MTQKSPVWNDREGAKEEEDGRKMRKEEVVEERQQGEGESASETSEYVGGIGGRGIELSPHHFTMKEEEESDDEEQGGDSEVFISMYRPEGQLLCWFRCEPK